MKNTVNKLFHVLFEVGNVIINGTRAILYFYD